MSIRNINWIFTFDCIGVQIVLFNPHYRFHCIIISNTPHLCMFRKCPELNCWLCSRVIWTESPCWIAVLRTFTKSVNEGFSMSWIGCEKSFEIQWIVLKITFVRYILGLCLGLMSLWARYLCARKWSHVYCGLDSPKTNRIANNFRIFCEYANVCNCSMVETIKCCKMKFEEREREN